MRLVIHLLLLGALAFDLCQAQDYPVFRRARIRVDEDDSQEAGQISQQRTRKFKVRVRPRPTVITSIAGEEEDVSLEAVPQTLHVVQQQPTQLIAQDPVRLVTSTPYRSRGTSPQPPPAIHSSVVRERKEPVQALRNFSNINQDGSFTFGYEGADGSFKEETRGIDCVVRGKYGYIDPQGVRREFSYVSGNPCDPNAEEEEEDEPSLPQRAYPRRPVSTVAPTLVTHAQRLEQVVEEQVPHDQLPEIYRQFATAVTRRPAVTTTQRPRTIARPSVLAVNSLSLPQPLPQPVHQHLIPEEPTTYRPSLRLRYPTSTAAPTLVTPTTRSPTRASTRVPRPVTPTTQGSIFSFDYDVSQDNVFNSHPAYAIPAAVPQQTFLHRPSPSEPARSQVNVALPGAAAIGHSIYHGASPVYHTVPVPQPPEPVRPHFQQPLRQVPVQKRRKATSATTTTAKPTPAQVIQKAQQDEAQGSVPVYTSELVFDPNTGQYTTVLLHQLPHTNGAEVSLNHRLQAFVQPPSPAPTVILRSQAQPPQGHHPTHLGNFVQQPYPLQYQPGGFQQYYVPAGGRPNGASGQIDHFLRNYNAPY